MSKEELNLDYRKAYEVFKDTMREGNYLLSVKSALEKQIPKKPTLKIFADVDEETGKNFYPRYYLCSVCGGLIGAKHNRHCSSCGQALDWSDTK